MRGGMFSSKVGGFRERRGTKKPETKESTETEAES